MSRIGPFATAPQLVERKAGWVDMMLRNDPNAAAYQFWGAPTLDDAYGDPALSLVGGAGPEVMFEVSRGSQFRSPAILRRKLGWFGENLRGMTRVGFDPGDFVSATTSLPPDDNVAFLRVQENRPSAGGLLVVAGVVNTGDPKLGPIYVVPPASFFGTPNPTLSIQGTAPAGTGCVAGAVPAYDLDIQVPNPMHVVLPRAATSVLISNQSAADTLLVSAGVGDAMIAVGPTDDPAVVLGAAKDIVVAGDGAAVPFSVFAVIGLGPLG